MYDLVLFTHHFYNENELLPSAVLHRLKIIKKSQALNNLNPEENEGKQSVIACHQQRQRHAYILY